MPENIPAKIYTQKEIDSFVEWAQSHLPRFQVCFKEDSWLQKGIGKLLWPINREYMTRYTTVMFGKVYFPSRQKLEEWGESHVYALLRHEFVHLMDAKRFPFWFEFSYLFLLPCFFTFRAFWEMRGYTQTMLVEFESTGDVSDELMAFIAQRFVSSDYGWMFPFRKKVHAWIKQIRQDILSGRIQGAYPYCHLP